MNPILRRYYRRREEGRDPSHDSVSVILDKMDSNKTTVPFFARGPGSWWSSLKKQVLQQHVLAVLVHGRPNKRKLYNSNLFEWVCASLSARFSGCIVLARGCVSPYGCACSGSCGVWWCVQNSYRATPKTVTEYLYTVNDSIKGDANLNIEGLRRTYADLFWDRPMPRTLYIQADNASDNKCWALVAWLAMLVHHDYTSDVCQCTTRPAHFLRRDAWPTPP
jgi:hypothetical protein